MNPPHFDTNALNKTISGIRLGDFKANKVQRIRANATYEDWGVNAGETYKVRYKEFDSPCLPGNRDLVDFFHWELDGLEIIELD